MHRPIHLSKLPAVCDKNSYVGQECKDRKINNKNRPQKQNNYCLHIKYRAQTLKKHVVLCCHFVFAGRLVTSFLPSCAPARQGQERGNYPLPPAASALNVASSTLAQNTKKGWMSCLWEIFFFFFFFFFFSPPLLPPPLPPSRSSSSSSSSSSPSSSC